MSTKDISAYIGTTLTVINQIPQIYKAIKTKKTTDISMFFLISLLLSHISWLIYAISDDINVILIVNSSFCLLLTKILIFLKLKFDKKVNDVT